MIKKILIQLSMLFLISCGNSIKVGSKNFTESLIVSEIYAQSLEKEGIKVDRVFNIAGNLIHNSIISGEIDLYPEYTGTALISILKKPIENDENKIYDIVSKEYLEKFNIKWLEKTDINDSNGIAITKKISDKLNIKNLTDLQKYASSIRFASQGEFHIREDALMSLNRIYGEFKFKSLKVYSNELKYRVLDENLADATIVYTTEGNLSNKDKYVLLTDDKKAFPPYNMVAIVRTKVLEKNPKIEKILNEVDKKLSNDILIKMNAMVDIDGLDYFEVARKFVNGSLDGK